MTKASQVRGQGRPRPVLGGVMITTIFIGSAVLTSEGVVHWSARIWLGLVAIVLLGAGIGVIVALWERGADASRFEGWMPYGVVGGVVVGLLVQQVGSAPLNLSVIGLLGGALITFLVARYLIGTTND